MRAISFMVLLLSWLGGHLTVHLRARPGRRRIYTECERWWRRKQDEWAS